MWVFPQASGRARIPTQNSEAPERSSVRASELGCLQSMGGRSLLHRHVRSVMRAPARDVCSQEYPKVQTWGPCSLHSSEPPGSCLDFLNQTILCLTLHSAAVRTWPDLSASRHKRQRNRPKANAYISQVKIRLPQGRRMPRWREWVLLWQCVAVVCSGARG